MNKKFFSPGLCLCIASITGCVTSAQDANYEWVGGIMGGNVVYNVEQLNPSKYLLEATTVNSVSAEKLIAAYKIKGAKLCHPKTASYQYKLSTEQYMGTFNATMKLPMTAPKVVGLVTCK